MTRLLVSQKSEAQAVMEDLHKALERRLSVSSLAPCPVEFTGALIGMTRTQSCGKCTPCRVGLGVLKHLIDDVLEGRASEKTLDQIEEVAEAIYLSADCAIGYESGRMALSAIRGFRDDFEHHISHHLCGFEQDREVPCVAGCPAHVDIPGYISLVRAGRYQDAVRLIRKDNPMPIVCGMVCEHPCEMQCRRGMVDDPMNIRMLKRFACDNMEEDYRPTIAPATGKRVAVVGGGPAGLSAAYYLTVMGHKVVLFEQFEELGGMLRYGIPRYRLPHAELDREIEWLIDCGIEVHKNTRIESVEKLSKEYDAVFMAIGAHNDCTLGIEGEDAQGVMSAVDLLHQAGSLNDPDFSGKRVCVVGGGNVAMDVARTSIRCGAESVKIIYRRRRLDMTAHEVEIEGAIAEGCEVVELYSPLAIEKDAQGKVSGLKVQRQVIGGLDASGKRPAPRNADCDPEVIDCDIVAVAIGQSIDSESFGKEGVELKRGKIVTDASEKVEAFEGVFAGGDSASGPATVIMAINAGKVGAANIDHYLGYDHQIVLDVDLPPVDFVGVASCARCEPTERPAGERKGDFDCVECGYTAEEAYQESSRCLHCDHFGFGGFRGGRTFQW